MDDGVLLCCNPAMSTAVSEPASPAFSPLYQQIKALMVRELQAGTWRPGEAIPSETELALRFKVSQGTVRKALDALGTPYQYLEYGSYLSQWRRRNALKMWTGWPTFPMVFVKGTLVGGADNLQALIASGELNRLLAT